MKCSWCQNWASEVVTIKTIWLPCVVTCLNYTRLILVSRYMQAVCVGLLVSTHVAVNGNWLFMTILPLVLMRVIPGRLCDGPSSPCRPQATSCWAPPATSSSCWKRRCEWRRAWRCHRKAGSDSCRTCCWERFLTYDRLTVVRLSSYPLLDVHQCSCHRWSMQFVSSSHSFQCSLATSWIWQSLFNVTFFFFFAVTFVYLLCMYKPMPQFIPLKSLLLTIVQLFPMMI